jgi:putative cofactor-binding repeat protein
MTGVGLAPALASSGRTVTVGDPANPASLAKAIQEAYASGIRKICVSKGVYLLPDSPGVFCKLDQWQDAELIGEGVTFIAEVPTDHKGLMNCIFELNRCKCVRISGFVISQSEVTFRQGKVTSIDPGDGMPGSWSCVWKADDGYADLPVEQDPKLIGSLNIVDAATHRLKVKTGDIRDLTWQPEPRGSQRLRGFKSAPNLAVGDWLVGRRNDVNIPYKVRLRDSEGCTLQDLTLTRNGFAAIFEGGGSGNVIRECRWEMGPKPPGATEEPLVCASADGFHSVGAMKGPVVEECVMEGILLDDCIAINGTFALVLQVEGTTVTLANNKCGVALGEPIQIAGKTGDHQAATVIDLKIHADKTVTLTLDHAIHPPSEGAIAWATRHCGAGYRIERCRIGNTRSRGILVKADDGVISGNLIEEARMAAVNIGPEEAYKESGSWGNIIVQNNTIRNCGGYGYGGGAIWVHGHGGDTIDNIDITVSQNRFILNYQGDLKIEGAEHVLVAGNIFTGRTSMPFGMPRPTLARVSNSRDVRFISNPVVNPAAYATPLVKPGPNVSGLSADWGDQP